MATITTVYQLATLSDSETTTGLRYQSAPATVATSDLVDISGLNDHFGHWFCSVQMYDVSGAQIVGGAGTFAVQVATWVNGVLEAPPTATIDATAPETIDWKGPTTRVVVTPTGLTTAVTWVVRLAAVRT